MTAGPCVFVTASRIFASWAAQAQMYAVALLGANGPAESSGSGVFCLRTFFSKQLTFSNSGCKHITLLLLNPRMPGANTGEIETECIQALTKLLRIFSRLFFGRSQQFVKGRAP